MSCLVSGKWYCSSCKRVCDWWQYALDITHTETNIVLDYQIAFLKATGSKGFDNIPQSIDRDKIVC
jgi:hypothetical protein